MKKQSKRVTIAILILAVAVWFGLSQGLGYLYRENVIKTTKTIFDMIMLTMIIPYVIALPAAYLLLRTRTKAAVKPQKLGWKETLRAFVVQSGLSIPAMVLLNLIIFAVTGQSGGMDQQAIADHLVFYLILLLIFNPIMEEVLFRKLILDRFLPYGENFAILNSAILFALPHIYSQGMPSACYTFILALIWGRITVRTGSIKQAILLHSLSNVWGCFLPMLLTAHTSTMPIYFIVFIIGMPIAAVIVELKEHKQMKQSQITN